MRWMRRRERELEEEMQAHLRLAEQDRIRNGESPDTAGNAARREFGNAALVREDVRYVWGWTWLESLVQDIRFALRNFARNRGTTAIIIFTLAAGIGANTAVFSVLDAVLLRQPPYRSPDRLVSILDLQKSAGGRATFFDLYSDYQNWTRNSKLFDGFAASTWARGLDRTLSGSGPARRVPVLPVTADYFAVLGVPPVLGRTFQPSDRDRGCTIVMSHEFWRTVTGGRTSLIGKPLQLDDQDCLVMGVMPPGFAVFPNPAAMLWALMPTPDRPDQYGVFVIGRVKPGVSMAAAQTELLTLHRQLHQRDRWGALMEPRVYPLQAEFTWLTGRNLKLSLIILFSAVTMVLLICCANVSILLLGQSLARGREMAIRAALGSGRGRLLRQLLSESLLLSAAAALIGVALATGAVQYFRSANPIELPPATVVQVDARILAFTVLLSILNAVLFGLAPAWNTSRADLNAALKAGGRCLSHDAANQRFGSVLIVAEVALTMVLLAGAGLLIRSVERFGSAPLGFQPDGLMTTRIQLPQRAYARPEARLRFYDNLLGQLLAMREIEGEALSTVLPTNGTGPVVALSVEGQPDPEPNRVLDVGIQTVSQEYFQVMRIPLKRGRFFNDRDRADGEPVTVVNEAVVARYFPNEDPIGRHIRQFEEGETKTPWLRIVGVVASEKRTRVETEMGWLDAPVMYRPWLQDAHSSAVLILRTTLPESAAFKLVQRAGGDPDVSVGDMETVPHALAKVLAYPRFRAIVLTAFAALALLLAVVGLYGVLARQVTQRTPEIGIRMALGARPGDVLAMVAKRGSLLTLIGIAVGLAATWGLTRLLSGLLYGVSATDAATLELVTVGLLTAAELATVLPARRATRVDPMIALRSE